LLRVAADNLQAQNPTDGDDSGAASSIFDRAVAEESLLHSNSRAKVVPDLPERLVTQSQIDKNAARLPNEQMQPGGLVAFGI
jgi:hypothetical protein